MAANFIQASIISYNLLVYSCNLQLKVVVIALSKVVDQRASVEKVSSSVSQNSQESTCAGFSF